LSEDLQQEQALVEAAQHDPEAFGALYERYFARIYNYAYHHTGDQAQAEDVTAQTFKQALENFEKFEWRGVPLGAWLYRIASNVIVGQHRKTKPSTPFEDAIETPLDSPTPEEAFLRNERNAELAAAVRLLPESQQQAIILRFAQNLSYLEIAHSIGRTEGAVKQLIHRGLVSLRQNLQKEG
jgi:RNA polymerase sigma-70 factor (ECF subfamily)